MTADSQWEMQKAVVTALEAASALTSIIGADKVCDRIPSGTAYPYVVVGDTTAIPFDTKDTDGMEQTLTLHTWSQSGDYMETKQIMEAIVDALDDVSLSLTGHTLILILFEFSNVFRDPDSKTRHGVQRFRALTQKP